MTSQKLPTDESLGAECREFYKNISEILLDEDRGRQRAADDLQVRAFGTSIRMACTIAVGYNPSSEQIEKELKSLGDRPRPRIYPVNVLWAARELILMAGEYHNCNSPEGPQIKLPTNQERIDRLKWTLLRLQNGHHPYSPPEFLAYIYVARTMLERLLRNRIIYTWEFSREIASQGANELFQRYCLGAFERCVDQLVRYCHDWEDTPPFKDIISTDEAYAGDASTHASRA